MKENPSKLKGKMDKIAQIGVLAASLACSSVAEAAEIPSGAAWSEGLNVLAVSADKESVETAGFFVRTQAGAKIKQSGIYSAEGAPMDPEQTTPLFLARWAKRNKLAINCVVLDHTHPKHLMEKTYKKSVMSIPPSMSDIDAMRFWEASSKQYGLGKFYAGVVDGLGEWTYVSLSHVDYSAAAEYAQTHSGRWPMQLERAAWSWADATKNKSSSDVPLLLQTDTYKKLVQEFANIGVKISFKSLADASKSAPCDRE